MLKRVKLNVAKIKYEGTSIGDDIHLEVRCLDKFKFTDKKIKKGEDVQVNLEVGDFTTDQPILTLPVQVILVEKDLVFNDVGKSEIKVRVDLKSDSLQKSILKVTVKEKRGVNLGRREASYLITLEALVEPAIKYIPKTPDGWLLALKSRTTKPDGLPSFLRVQVDKIDHGREYFTVLEGVRRGQKFSVKFINGSSVLVAEGNQTGLVKLTYSISKKILFWGRSRHQAVDYVEYKWSKGLYDIEIPDAPHQLGVAYLSHARYATVWFRIGHSEDRYIHAGGRSKGCITLVELKKWDALCEILMRGRKGDGLSVGVLDITD